VFGQANIAACDKAGLASNGLSRGSKLNLDRPAGQAFFTYALQDSVTTGQARMGLRPSKKSTDLSRPFTFPTTTAVPSGSCHVFQAWLPSQQYILFVPL
jgi:hypothetical protein